MRCDLWVALCVGCKVGCKCGDSGFPHKNAVFLSSFCRMGCKVLEGWWLHCGVGRCELDLGNPPTDGTRRDHWRVLVIDGTCR